MFRVKNKKKYIPLAIFDIATLNLRNSHSTTELQRLIYGNNDYYFNIYTDSS